MLGCESSVWGASGGAVGGAMCSAVCVSGVSKSVVCVLSVRVHLVPIPICSDPGCKYRLYVLNLILLWVSSSHLRPASFDTVKRILVPQARRSELPPYLGGNC